MISKVIGVIGTGNMGGAIIDGLMSKGIISPDNLLLTNRDIDKANRYYDKYKTPVMGAEEVIERSDIILIAVKPKDIDSLIPIFKKYSNKVLISVLAGITIDYFRNNLDAEIQVARAMPNIPSTISKGVISISYSENTSGESRDVIDNIFSSIGEVYHVEERLINVSTGLSGSSPAYMFLIIDAIAKVGIDYGMDRSTAFDMVIDTMIGSAMFMREYSQIEADTLVSKVTSPGGTTIEGLRVLNEKNILDGISSTIKTVIEKSFSMERKD